MTRKLLALVALLCACWAAVPAVASASVRSDIIDDCQDGELNGSYTAAQIRDARKHLPGDVAQYTDCDSVLRAAEIPDRPDTSGGGTGTAARPGTSTTAPAPELGGDGIVRPNPTDKGTLDDARKAGEQAITLDPNSLKPDAAVRLDRVSNGLPGSLLAALAALAVCTLVAVAGAVRNRGLPRLRRR